VFVTAAPRVPAADLGAATPVGVAAMMPAFEADGDRRRVTAVRMAALAATCVANTAAPNEDQVGVPHRHARLAERNRDCDRRLRQRAAQQQAAREGQH
jgi:hypothetical protein